MAKKDALATDLLPEAVRPYAASVALPPGTLKIETYAEYRDMIQRFTNGKLDDTLVTIGGAGIGKSEIALQEFGQQEYCYIKGQATRFGVYLKLFEYMHKPVVLDDVDSLLASKDVTGLLKMLLETRSPRTIQWTTAQTMLQDVGVPARFATKSRTMILANELKQVSKNFGAVLDRCTIVWFAPGPDEVHKYAGTWFVDEEVYQFVGQRIHATPAPSCRYYYHGKTWKRAGLDWKKMLGSVMQPNRNKAMLALELAMRYKSPSERVAAWKKETGCSEQAYWATKRAVDKQHGKSQSDKGRAISEAMKRKHAERKAQRGLAAV